MAKSLDNMLGKPSVAAWVFRDNPVESKHSHSGTHIRHEGLESLQVFIGFRVLRIEVANGPGYGSAHGYPTGLQADVLSRWSFGTTFAEGANSQSINHPICSTWKRLRLLFHCVCWFETIIDHQSWIAPRSNTMRIPSGKLSWQWKAHRVSQDFSIKYADFPASELLDHWSVSAKSFPLSGVRNWAPRAELSLEMPQWQPLNMSRLRSHRETTIFAVLLCPSLKGISLESQGNLMGYQRVWRYLLQELVQVGWSLACGTWEYHWGPGVPSTVGWA